MHTSSSIETPTPEQQARVTALLREKGIQLADTSQAIPTRPADVTIPLTTDMARIWSLHHLDPTSAAYNMSCAWQLQGPLDVGQLERSLQALSVRHTILQTCFPEENGKPIQRPATPSPVTQIDLTTWPQAQREASAAQLACDLIRQPFDLATESPYRAALFRLDTDQYRLLFVFHQIVFDGPSGHLFHTELSTLYAAAGQPSDLPALPVQVADVAYQEHNQSADGQQRECAYWQRQLGEITPLALPQDSPRPARETWQGASESLHLSAELSTTLHTLAQTHQTTLFNLLLAVINTWAYGLTRQQDILIYTSAAGRQRAELQPLIGLFARQLPLRIRLQPEHTFAGLLNQVQQTSADAWVHQALPFAELMDFLQPTLGYTPADLFQMMLIDQHTQSNDFTLPGLQTTPWSVQHTHAEKFDLRWSVRQTQGQITLTLVYKTDLFHAETIQTLLNQFSALLSQVAATPDQSIKDLTLDFTTPHTQQTVQTEPAQQKIAPGTQLETDLVNLWETLLKQQPIGIRDDFFALGGHSLLAVRLLEQVKARIGCDLPLATLIQAPTIQQLAALIEQKQPQTHGDYLVTIQPKGNATPLFLVPPAGCGALRFAALAAYLGDERPIHSFDPQGLNDDMEPHPSIEDMAAAYIRDMQQQQPHGPYLLGGMCMGSHVALEMAQQLHTQNEATALLMSLDAGAPASGPTWSYAPSPIKTRLQKGIIHLRQGTLRKHLLFMLRNRIQQAKDQLFFLRTGNRHFKQLKSAHVQAQFQYTAKLYPGAVALLQSHEYAQERYAKTPQESEHLVRWSSLCTGTLHHYMIPNTTHRDALTKPENLRILAEQIQSSLKQHHLL